MNDDIGLFEETESAEADRVTRSRRRGRKGALVMVMVLLIAGGVWYGVTQVLGIGNYQDYPGTSGERDVLIQIRSGDSTTAIGDRLQQAGVVASAKAFTKAADDEDKVRGVQPGFYVMRTKVSGQTAVRELIAPGSRRGQLEVRSGWQLADTTAPDSKVTKGIMAKIAEASCADLNGHSTCVSVADLYAAGSTADPAALGVPEWAVPAVRKGDQQRRLEGLISPGLYTVRPGDNATDILKGLLTTSAVRLQSSDLSATGPQSSGYTPYQLLIVASIAEREAGLDADLAKITRVLYNRLAGKLENHKPRLGLDSTVAYGLNRPMIRMAPSERPKSGAYNTYDLDGLPPTPISSPSPAALKAAQNPADGTWTYFVVCKKDGTSCFANGYPEHQAFVAQAQAAGVW
jgi:UPF0755 protein